MHLKQTRSNECNQNFVSWPAALRRLQHHLYCRDIEPHRDEVLAYCERLSNDTQAAEDLMQETMLRGYKVVRQLHSGLDNPSAFLKRVARNLWVDRLRKSGKEVLGCDEIAIVDSARPLLYFELQDALNFVTKTLPPKEHTVFLVHALLGFSVREAADLLDTTESSIKMASSRARRRIRKALQSSTSNTSYKCY